MSIKAPTIGVEKAQTRPTGFIRSFSPPDSSPAEKGLALGSFLSQIFWKDRVVSNRVSKLWALELLCAYLVQDSRERARGVGKQPQPIRGIRKSFIIFHKMNVRLHYIYSKVRSIPPSAQDDSWFWHIISRFDMLLLPQQERLSQPILSRYRNAPFLEREF